MFSDAHTCPGQWTDTQKIKRFVGLDYYVVSSTSTKCLILTGGDDAMTRTTKRKTLMLIHLFVVRHWQSRPMAVDVVSLETTNSLTDELLRVRH